MTSSTAQAQCRHGFGSMAAGPRLHPTASVIAVLALMAASHADAQSVLDAQSGATPLCQAASGNANAAADEGCPP